MKKGVETNEFSRFVDHTLATPWETFISDIEKSIRLLNKLYLATNQNQLIELNVHERELLQLPTSTHHFIHSSSSFSVAVSPLTPAFASPPPPPPTTASPVLTGTSNSAPLNPLGITPINSLPGGNFQPILYDPHFLQKKILLKYLEMEFILEEFTFHAVGNLCSQTTWIWKLLQFPTFFLFYYVSNSNNTTISSATTNNINANNSNNVAASDTTNYLSMKMTILSAFTIAVKAVNELQVPTFFTMEKFDLWNLNSIKDCIGYRPVRLILNHHVSLNLDAHHPSGVDHTASATALASAPAEDTYWIRYESMMIPLTTSNSNNSTSSIKTSSGSRSGSMISGNGLPNQGTIAPPLTKRHHPLYFFDGIRKLYQKKVSLLNLDYNSNIYEHFYSKIIHYYHYDKKLWMTASISLQNLYSNANYSGKKSYYILTNPYDYTSSTALEITMLANYTQKHFIDILTTILNCGFYKFYLFENLQISLTYREGMKQYSIIDNEAYSTLLPSKQSYSNWTLFPFFKKANYQLLPMNIYNILYFQWKAICIRRLLSIYILSTFIKFDGFDFHHFYMMMNNNNNVNISGGGLGGAGSTQNKTASAAAAAGNVFPEHFLLNTEHYIELQGLLNRCSKETKYIFGTIFPDEMIYSEKYYQYYQRSQTNSRSTATGEATAPSEDGSGASSERKKSVKEEESNNGTNSTFSFSQEQQYQQLFQQVFQYLFVSKNDYSATNHPNNNTAAVEATAPAFPDENITEDITGNKLNYIENWIQAFGILSGLLPLKGPYLLRLWQYCLRELQHVYDTDLFLPWAQKSFGVNLNVDYQDDTSSPYAVGGGGGVGEVDGLYGKSLWNDVIYKKKKDLQISIIPPDINKPILIQKLMMIFFCIFMKKEKITYEIKAITAASSLDENHQPIAPSSYPPPMANPLETLKSVTLFRRIPLTSDIIAMQQHMLKKFQFERSKIDTITKEHPLIKYQITVPTLLSDMALFKYNNPTITFPVFYKWYGLGNHPLLGIEDIDEWAEYLQPDSFGRGGGGGGSGDEEYDSTVNDELEREFIGRPSQANILLSFETIESEKEIVTLKLLQGLSEIFYTMDPRSIKDQKPIFSAEKEIGKSIAYLERMSISNFLLEIIYYSLHFICSFIDQSNTYFHSKKIFLLFIQEKLIILKNQLAKLNMIIENKRKIIPNISSVTSSSNTTSGNSGTNSPGNTTPLPQPQQQQTKADRSDSYSTTGEGGGGVGGGGSNKYNLSSSSFPTSTAPPSYVSGSAPPSSNEVSNEEIIHLVDSICVIIEELELFYCKLHQLLPIIEVTMNSPFRQSSANSKSNGNNQPLPEEEEEEEEDENLEINDNILQLILHWIENNQEYSCQSSNEVNYIKMMMKTCYHLQQQQQPSSSSASSNTIPATTSASTTNAPVSSNQNYSNEFFASPSSPSMAGHTGKHNHRNRLQSNSYDSNISNPRKESRESSDPPGATTVKSIDSTSTVSHQDHDWYSYDGRELPSLPNSKEFHLFSAAKYPIPHLEKDTNLTKPTTSLSLIEPVKLDFTLATEPSAAGTNEKKVPSLTPRKKDVNEFSMILSTDGNSMRMIHEILEIN